MPLNYKFVFARITKALVNIYLKILGLATFFNLSVCYEIVLLISLTFL